MLSAGLGPRRSGAM